MSKVDWAAYRRDFTNAAKKSGFASECIAETASGPIEAWIRGESGTLVYVSAGIHGDEPAAPLALLKWMQEGGMEEGVRWAVIPILNPTGLESTTRENAQGVDLNRDYKVRRTPEVRAHVDWLKSNPVPALFVSLHEDWEATGFYLYEIRHNQDTPDLTRRVLRAAEAVIPLEPGAKIDGHETRGQGWIFHGRDPDEPEGWPEAIYLSRLGCPLSFTMETPSSALLAQRVDCQLAALNCLLSSWKNACKS